MSISLYQYTFYFLLFLFTTYYSYSQKNTLCDDSSISITYHILIRSHRPNGHAIPSNKPQTIYFPTAAVNKYQDNIFVTNTSDNISIRLPTPSTEKDKQDVTSPMNSMTIQSASRSSHTSLSMQTPSPTTLLSTNYSYSYSLFSNKTGVHNV